LAIINELVNELDEIVGQRHRDLPTHLKMVPLRDSTSGVRRIASHCVCGSLGV
jgi:hypothetical protein